MNEAATFSKQKSINVFDKESLLKEYRIAQESRQASLMGRKEVFMGKAKFGIFGDGKELAQIAMARHFQNGDFHLENGHDLIWIHPQLANQHLNQ